MGSHKKYRLVFIVVLLLFFASAGRIFAQDENPPAEPTGALGEPPVQPASPPSISAPPSEAPDSTPVIEHPPENEPQPTLEILTEHSEATTQSNPTIVLQMSEKQPELKAQVKLNFRINKRAFIR